MTHRNVQQLFCDTVDTWPTRIAIDGERVVTYRELGDRTNVLARRLISSGAAPGGIVAVLAEDIVDTVTATIGVLKAGAVFMPLDPNLPQYRLEQMLATASPSHYLVDRKLAERVRKNGDGAAAPQLVDIATEEASGKHAVERQLVAMDPDAMAYLVFTSGSTGRPKAIAGRLKGIDHFIKWEIELLGLDEAVRVSQFTLPIFDAFLRDLFVPLTTGGTLCVPPSRDDVMDSRRLVEYIERSRVTLIHCVPSLFRLLFSEKLTADRFPQLRQVLLAGEEVQPSDVSRWREIFGDRIQLVNLYGPSETTMTKFFYMLGARDAERRVIPIGKPMPGARALVVNANGGVCPPGQIGEILIRTPYRSLGYYGDPDRTREVFIPNPFNKDDPKDLVYRTGDLGRILGDGNFEFQGRRDLQVKIRGVRIELGEIESRLRDHPAVTDAAVVDQPDSQGQRLLCAFVVLDNEAVEVAELDAHLRSRLPDYMVPSILVKMEQLPRTLSGKIDRRGLPSYADIKGSHEDFAAPRNPTEEVIAEVWRALLRRAEVGVHDNFFQSGGHSLLATQVIARLRQIFAIDLSLKHFFAAPTVAALAARVSRERRGAEVLPAIERAEDEGPTPLSFSQERVWFLCQLAPDSAAYNLPIVVNLVGELRRDVLYQGLLEVVRRHSMLRTRFVASGGTPHQVSDPPGRFTWSFVDLEVLDSATGSEVARRLTRAEVSRPFDLGSGPPFRVLLFRLEPTRHRLIVNQHHIISDAWSNQLLIREVSEIYRATVRGEAPSLPELTVRYSDFARWQRERLRGEPLEHLLIFWKNELEGAPSLLELPLDRPRPRLQTFVGAIRTGRVSAALGESLRAASQREGATLFMTLMAAFKLLLASYSGQQDLVVGTPVAGRLLVEVESIIGFFVNTLVVRSDSSRSRSFRDFLRQIRETVINVYDHQEMPFEKLVEEIQPQRSLQYSPLFQVIFILQNVPRRLQEVGDLKLIGEVPERGTSKFDINLSVLEDGNELRLLLEYNTDLFDATTIERFLGRYRDLLAAVVEDSAADLRRFGRLSPLERHQLLREWNDTATAPAAGTLHELFERQARRQPDAVAVVTDSGALTYEEVDQRSNRLARFLLAAGLRRGGRVGILLDRGGELIWVLLGILKAGGVYVPLETRLPAARLQWILAVLDARWIVTQSFLLDRLEGIASDLPALSQVVCVDVAAAAVASPSLTLRGREHLEEQAASACGSPVEGGDVAYIIFTSGSTGRPKGVMVRHAPVLNLIRWVNTTFGVGPGDRGLFVTSLSFDLSVYDIFGLLAAGGTVRVAATGAVGDPERLVAMLSSEPITFWDSAPAALQQMVPYFPTDPLPTALRLVFLSGDWVPLGLPDTVCRSFTGARVVALGGATEAVIWSNFFPVGEVRKSWVSIPYGRPIDNARYHALDADLRPIAIGVSGDLFIAGNCLAVGYAQASAHTAWQFVPDPFGGVAGGRMYRTGDRVRTHADGSLEFLGRLDHQVKVRGFRVELGEIEAVLAEHPGVREAVVLAYPEADGNQRLVAYVVANAAPGPSTAELRAHGATRLPEYMVPALFIPLAELPVTPNGKLDRKALPAPTGERPVMESSYVAPRTDTERILTELWSRLLGVAQVGVEDDFFQLGGHSLIATQVMAALRERFQVEVPLRQLFEGPTVEALARHVLQARAEKGDQPAAALPTIEPDPAHRFVPFPLSEVQQAYWVGRTAAFELGNVSSHIYSEYESSDVDLERLTLALRRLIDRHEMLRMIILPDGQQQILESVPPLEIEVTDLRGLPGDEVEARLLAIRDRLSHEVRPADVWPLFGIRATRLDTAGKERLRLHLSLEALIHDAWSLTLLRRDLLRFYVDPEASLEPLELSFRDYVLAEEDLRSSPIFQTSLDYWSRRIPDLPPRPELPLARSASSLSRPQFRRRRGELDQERWERLKSRAARAGLTPSGLVAAAFAHILGMWSRHPRLTLNLTLFNRLPLHPQVSQVVGDFTSLTLLAVEPVPGATFEVFARSVQERLWDDLDHRFVSGVRILRELARRKREVGGALMPVVLTSTLGLNRETPPELRHQGWSVETIYSISQTPQVWLDHQVAEGSLGLYFNWDAIEKLFPEGFLDALFGAYCRFLERLAVDDESWHEPRPEWLLEQDLAVRRHINATAAPAPGGLLQMPFLKQARRTPERPAVIAPGRVLSYGELRDRSLALGRRLRSAGARPDQLVAVVMDKGWEQVVAVLGVLHSGAAYVPIDAGQPQQRLHTLLERSEARWIVTQPGLEHRLAWPAGAVVIAVEEEAPTTPVAELPPVQHPEDLAYVIFTSGSTGVPKGVMIEHRSALNTVVDVNERFAVGSSDRVLGLSALSFDLSVYDIFGLLSAGGALVLPEATAQRDPQRWAELVREHHVTVWNSVPVLMEMLVEYVEARDDSDISGLRRILLSGDWIPVSLPQRVRKLIPGARVISLGGATEGSIWSIFYPVEKVDSAWASIPYGQPLANQWLQVLDEELRPCPTWVPGELFIGGLGVARGYWQDSEQTAARFIELPSVAGRVYQTGDLGRYVPDGTIEFLGREDFQVKIRGHRIELGEIEAALKEQPGVRGAVVNVVGEGGSDRRLVAYLVPARESFDAPGNGTGGNGDPRIVAVRAEQVVWSNEGSPEEVLPEGPLRTEAAVLDFKLRWPGLRRGDRDRRSLVLPRPPLESRRVALYEWRRSERRFRAEALELEQLAQVLAVCAQIEIDEAPLPRYRYPSAGHLYPVQVYLHIRPDRVTGLPAGVYYYDPRQHRLVVLDEGLELHREFHEPVNQDVFQQATFTLFLVARMKAIRPIYGDLARELCLLEAGYMGQLLMMTAPVEQVGFCPIGTLAFDSIRQSFHLEDDDLLVHALLAGPVGRKEAACGAIPVSTGDPDPEGSAPWSAVPEAEGRWPEASEEPPPFVFPPDGTVLDGLAGLDFKIAQPGLRRDDGRRPRLDLERPEISRALLDGYLGRRTHREFLAEAVPVLDLAGLLGNLLAEELESAALPRRLYPSAGGLYPVQVYLYVRPGGVESLPAGTYFYHPRDHRLVQLDAEARLGSDVHVEVNRSIERQAAFSIFLVADMRAIEPLYGEHSADFCRLEAGYLGQLLMMVAGQYGLGLCPIGRVDFERVRQHLALDGSHRFVHCLFGGRISEPLVAARAWPVADHAAVDTPAPLLERVRSALRKRLPDYMQPTAFMVLKALPLSANGKIDRRALPMPDVAPASRDRGHVAPTNEIERTLVAIIGDVLSIDRVGIYDNFFDLGGNSVHLVRVHRKLRQELGREIAVVEMFNHPTVHDLARHLGHQEEKTPPSIEISEKQAQQLRAGRHLLSRRRQQRATDLE